jgi:hypothetical protein
MTTHELRDLAEASRYLLEGLWLQRAAVPTAATVRPALEWALEIASSGNPLPPTGFVADVGHAIFSPGGAVRQATDASTSVGLPAGLARTYEDHVLGKLYADFHFERAGDALRRYQGRDRIRGLAFVVNQFRERANFPGVFLSPAVIRGFLELPPDEVLARGWETLGRNGLFPLLPELYHDLIAASRRIAEVLGPEDIFELEHGTALLELGQRVALRQVLQTTDRLEAALPAHHVRAPAGRHAVPTRILDEDTYPVGGYSSVSNRGSIESLLHSQLAYMEASDERPDMFDIKFLRDELLYYSRDENQFLRRRRAFIFGLSADLVRTRFKDAELPVQRIVLLLSLTVAVVRKISEWLSTDALVFTFTFLDGGDSTILADEQGLLGLILREPISNGTVRLERRRSPEELTEECRRQARRSLCHCLLLGIDPPRLASFEPDDTFVSRLTAAGPTPVLGLPQEFDSPATGESDSPLSGWAGALERLLRAWS